MQDKIKLGAHVSITGGLLGAAKEAQSYGANTFMTYTGAPQNTIRKPVEKLKIEEGHTFMQEAGISGFVVHAPYIINLASFKADIYELAVSFLRKEIDRTEAFGAELLVLHPGAYTERDLGYGVGRIIDGLNDVLANSNVIVCLETMAGKGTEIGRSFEELKMIIDGVERKDKIAVCFDTCHVFDAGYDIVTDLDGVMKAFDSIVGLDYIKIFHLNGSLNKMGSKKDRHANIGAKEGNPKGIDNIGFDAIYRLVHSKYAEGRYLILETPWLNANENLYRQEIAMLRQGADGK